MLPRAAPPKLLRRRWKSGGTRPCTCCTSISVILQWCQYKHRGQPWLSALITRRRGRTYGWAVAARCARRELANLLLLQDFSGNKPEGKTSLVRRNHAWLGVWECLRCFGETEGWGSRLSLRSHGHVTPWMGLDVVFVDAKACL